MSAYPLTFSNGVYNYNFSVDSSQVYEGTAGYKELAPNIWGMPSGDANADGEINEIDKDLWRTEAGTNGYKSSDFNMNGQVENCDPNEFWYKNLIYTSQVPD